MGHNWQRREAKIQKRRSRMKVSGKSVFTIQKEIKKRANTQKRGKDVPN